MRLDINLTQSNDKRNVFFTSDFHLFHHNVLIFDNRPFADVNEMHIAIEKRWNEVVNSNDIVIYLGDLSFARREDKANVESILSRLNGTIHYVMGNHDKFDEINKMTRFQSIQDYLEVKIKHVDNNNTIETLFCCMHYPIYSWNKSHHGSVMVHGHSHMSLSELEFHKTKKIFDVGVNGWDYKPVSYNKLIELSESRLNFNHH